MAGNNLMWCCACTLLVPRMLAGNNIMCCERTTCQHTLLHQQDFRQALRSAAHLQQRGPAASRTCSKPSRPAPVSAQACLCSRTWNSWPGTCPMPGAGQHAGRYHGGTQGACQHKPAEINGTFCPKCLDDYFLLQVVAAHEACIAAHKSAHRAVMGWLLLLEPAQLLPVLPGCQYMQARCYLHQQNHSA